MRGAVTRMTELHGCKELHLMYALIGCHEQRVIMTCDNVARHLTSRIRHSRTDVLSIKADYARHKTWGETFETCPRRAL